MNKKIRMPYEVIVRDNFHYMDETEQYKAGEFADATGAVERCRQIVDDYLESSYKVGMPASELWDSYVSFGEDPFVTRINMPPVSFSAWDYAKERCSQICGAGPEPASPAVLSNEEPHPVKPQLHFSKEYDVTALAKLFEKLTGKRPSAAELQAAKDKLKRSK